MRLARTGERGEVLRDQFDEAVVLEIPRRRNDDRVRRVVRAHVAAQIFRRDADDGIVEPDRRIAEIRAVPHRLQEEIVDQLVGRILVHFDLFENDFLLFRQFLRSNAECRNMSAEDVHRERDVPVDHLSVVTRRLFVGEGVEVSADTVHRFGDLPCRTARGALEEHMFDQVRDAPRSRDSTDGADVGPNADRRRTDSRHGLGKDP